MKKSKPNYPKLSLRKTAVTALSAGTMTAVNGGATITKGCAQPTTTVQHTHFDCQTAGICLTVYSLRCTE